MKNKNNKTAPQLKTTPAPVLSSPDPSPPVEVLAAGGLSFLIPFFVYWRGLMPGLAIEGDSGEIITVLHEFGVLHSPGFPGYVVLAKLWTTLLGWLDVAYAANLFSAFCGALSSYFIFKIGRKFQLCWSALCLSLIFAFSAEFWYASLATEVYTLAILSLLVILNALLELTPHRPQSAFKAGFASGLGFSIHVYAWALMPLILFYSLKKVIFHKQKQKLLFSGVGGFLLGLFPYLYFLFRAGRGVYVNEGGINSFSRFFDHVSWILQRERVEKASTLNIGQWMSAKLQQLGYFGHELLIQWGSLGLAVLLLALGFSVYYFRKERQHWTSSQQNFAKISFACLIFMPAVVWLIFTGDTTEAGLLAEMSVHLQTFYVFLVLSLMVLCWRFREESRTAHILILIPIFLLVQRWSDHNLGRNQIAIHHAEDLILNLEPNTILFGDNDNDLMTITYLLAVRQQRQDLALLNLMNGTEWNFENYKKLYHKLQWPHYSRTYYSQVVPLNIDSRPVYFSSWTAVIGYLEVSGQKNRFQIVPVNGAYRITENSSPWVEKVENENIQFKIVTTPTDFHLRDREKDVIATRAEYLFHQAEFLTQHQKLEAAKKVIQYAFQIPTLNQTEYGQALIKEMQKLLQRLPL